MWKVGICSLVLLIYGSLRAQDLSCYVQKNNVRLGEEIKFYFRVTNAKNAIIEFYPHKIAFPAQKVYDPQKDSIININLELIEDFVIDTKENDSSKGIWQGHYTARSWECGKIIIAPQKITINDSTFFFKQMLLTISEPTIGKNGELFDIEEYFVEIPKKISFVKWITLQWKWLLLISILTIGAVCAKRKKRCKRIENNIKSTSLKDRTILAIDALYKQKMWKKGMIKYHYNELSYILRAYLSNRYNLNLFECTTQQAYSVLKQTNLTNDTIEDIIELLQHADTVKFSQVENEEYKLEYSLEFCKRLVSETSPLRL